MPQLSPSAMKIQEALTASGLDRSVIEFTESTRTAQEAADRVGCKLGQIVKSLVFKGLESGEPILVLTSGVNRVDEMRLASLTGEPVGRADPEFVRTVTGFAIGGVPPLAHTHSIRTFIDEDLMSHESVWAAAGTPNAVFELTSKELEKISNGEVVRVK